MSFLIEDEMACPACAYPNKVEVWSVVNVKEDPELKDILLGGELNMAECVSCKHVFYAEHFIIYHESDRELMAFVYPLSHRLEEEKWRAKTAEADTQLSYKPLTLFGMDELVQQVQKEEQMNIQADIVKILANEHGFQIKTIRPGLARELGLPVVLPMSSAETPDARERVRQGVDHLLQINDRLFVYRELLNELNDGQHARIDL